MIRIVSKRPRVLPQPMRAREKLRRARSIAIGARVNAAARRAGSATAADLQPNPTERTSTTALTSLQAVVEQRAESSQNGENPDSQHAAASRQKPRDQRHAGRRRFSFTECDSWMIPTRHGDVELLPDDSAASCGRAALRERRFAVELLREVDGCSTPEARDIGDEDGDGVTPCEDSAMPGEALPSGLNVFASPFVPPSKSPDAANDPPVPSSVTPAPPAPSNSERLNFPRPSDLFYFDRVNNRLLHVRSLELLRNGGSGDGNVVFEGSIVGVFDQRAGRPDVFAEVGPTRRPLGRERVELFKISSYQDGDNGGSGGGDDGTVCTVCQENFSAGEPLMALDCAHRFHEGCVRNWFGQAASCPNCRRCYLEHDHELSGCDL